MKKWTNFRVIIPMFLLVCTSRAFSFEKVITLNDGTYSPSVRVCNISLIKDATDDGHTIYMQTISVDSLRCSEPGKVFIMKMSKADKNQFIITDSHTITKEEVRDCEPTEEEEPRCISEVYHPKTGELLMKE